MFLLINKIRLIFFKIKNFKLNFNDEYKYEATYTLYKVLLKQKAFQDQVIKTKN